MSGSGFIEEGGAKIPVLTPTQQQLVDESDYVQRQLYAASAKQSMVTESAPNQRQLYAASAGQNTVTKYSVNINGVDMVYDTYAEAEKAAKVAATYPLMTVKLPTEIATSAKTQAIPGPAAGPAPGSITEGISKALTGGLQSIEDLFETPAQGLRKLSSDAFINMATAQSVGNIFGTVASASAAVSTRLAAGLYESASFLFRPGAWGSLAGLPGTLLTAVADPEVKDKIVKNISSDIGGIVLEGVGGLVGGYIVGKAIGKLTETEVTGELPTRTSTLEPKSKYGLPEKPYGYQWTVKKELLPIQKEEFTIGKYQVGEVGYGEGWPKSGVGGFGYAETGGEMAPFLLTEGEVAPLEEIFIPYQKALYGYRPGLTPAGYGSIPYTLTKSGVDLSGLSAAGLVAVMRDYTSHLPTLTGPIVSPAITAITTPAITTQLWHEPTQIQEPTIDTINAAIQSPDTFTDYIQDQATIQEPIQNIITDITQKQIPVQKPVTIIEPIIDVPIVPEITPPSQPPTTPGPPKKDGGRFLPTRHKNIPQQPMRTATQPLAQGQSLFRVTLRHGRGSATRTIPAHGFHEALIKALRGVGAIVEATVTRL